MPTLENLIATEGTYELGIIDGTRYCWMDIVVSLAPDGAVTPVCMKDDWEHTLPARLIESQERIGDLETDLMYAKEGHAAISKELQTARNLAGRTAWLESEVSRLTHDLERFRQQEAAQRTSAEVSPGVRVGMYEVAYQREADNANPPICTLTNTVVSDGPCQCSWCCKVREAGTTMPATEWTQDGRRVNIAIREQTNSHIAPEAPIFRKLCQCDDCRELRAASGYQTTEIEGH